MGSVQKGDATELHSLLQTLSVSDFRTAGYLLAENVLPTLSSQTYWHYFVTIVPQNSKAYLGTFLKAAQKLYNMGQLQLSQTHLQSFALTCSDVDVSKMLTTLLPLLKTSDEVELLTTLFCHNQLSKASFYLVKAHTLPCYYQLFKLLRMAENATEIRQVALSVLRRGDALSYRITSMLKAYFDIKDLPVRLSFNVEDYQLSRLEQGYENFVKMVKM